MWKGLARRKGIRRGEMDEKEEGNGRRWKKRVKRKGKNMEGKTKVRGRG